MNITSVWIIWYGHFGSFIHQIVTTYFPGVAVKVASRTYEKALSWEEVAWCDLVFPCVPLARFEDCIDRLVPLLWKDTILVDVCTVKSMPISCLQKYIGVRYLCTHPMFGPQSYKKQGNSLADLRIVLCDSTLPIDLYDAWVTVLNNLWLKVLEMTADEHDQKLASTLFLTHYIAQIVYAGEFDRTDIDTVTFWYLMDAVESVSEDKDLFLDVWRYNPYCKEIVKKFNAVQSNIELELRDGSR